VTFYRPGGSTKAINRQYDCVYVDAAGLATGWLPVNEGDALAVNIARASIVFNTPASSTVTMTPIAPECSVLMEMKLFGTDPNSAAFPVDQWQNMVVATSRDVHGSGWVRLRALAINNGDGTGINMALRVARSGRGGRGT
jgi:hypothetical protein